MGKLEDEVAKSAEHAAEMSRSRGGLELDYTSDSLAVVEEMIAEAAVHHGELSDHQLRNLAQDLGCYVLEVARRMHGGTYQWDRGRGEPVLIAGESRVALFTWETVLGRLNGTHADSITGLLRAFAEQVEGGNRTSGRPPSPASSFVGSS